MKKLFTLLLFSTIIATATATTKDSLPKAETKVTFQFGGRVDLMLMSDSRDNIDSRNGTQYLFPNKPVYNSKGEDINAQGQLRFSVAPTRLHFAATATNVLGATARGYVEIDFMGVSDNVLSTIRMRHAYMTLKWRNRSILLGQTSHLTMVDEIASNTVTFGGGYPFSPLNRPIQLQFTQQFGKHANITIAAAMFGGSFGTAQSYTFMPDIQLRLQFGNPAKFTYGIMGGVKSIKPRTITADSSLTNKKLTTFDAGLFARYTFGGGYAVRLYGIWGQDMSQLAMIGGYAPLLSDRGVQDYGYSATSTVSASIDFESKQYKSGLRWGIFGGYQANLGSNKALDLKNKPTFSDYGIDSYWRIAPRLWYNYKNFLSFGVEYMFTGASWAKSMNDNYRPAERYPEVYNNRVTILARYKFLTK